MQTCDPLFHGISISRQLRSQEVMTDPTVAADGKARQLILFPVCLLPAQCQHA